MEDVRSLCKFPQYVNFDYGPIGKSTSTKEQLNTATDFHFWIAEGVDSLELGNIVAAVGDNGHVTFGFVTELRTIMDVESFLSDYISHNFGDPHILPPSDAAEMIVAKCNIIKSTTERVRPIGRAVVYYASEEGVAWSLGMLDYAEKGQGVPIGVMENGDGSLIPIFLDEEFLVGPEGSHLNMSGISGLATKTSLVEFLLKSMLDTMTKSQRRRAAAIFFNVKGKDLLYLDKPNPQYDEDDSYTQKCRKMYEKLGVSLEPFENVRIFAPYDRKYEGHTKSFRRDGKVEHFIWELGEIVDDIPTLFSEDEWDEAVEAVWVDIRDQIERQPIKTYDELLEYLYEERRVLANANVTHWHGHEKQVFYKTAKNLDALGGLYDGLICVGGVDEVDIPLHDLHNGSIFVIDIQSLNDRGQMMVFNKIMKRVYNILLDKNIKKDFDTVVFFVDELNKFAPRDPTVRAPIKQRLIEICARGRSLGISLFGVEQFMSQVDRQVVDNSATIIYGRTGPAELMTAEYNWLDSDVRNRLTSIPRGTFLLKHAKFVQPIFCKFPYPPCVPGDQYDEEAVGVKREVAAALSYKRDV